jgi:class 3 adenylate cyclase
MLFQMAEISSLFTDIVRSTETAVALGDDAWAALLERHHGAVRAQIARFGGDEMDTSGDGFFVIFSEPAAAIGAGEAIVGAVEALKLSVRIGIHVGDCRVADGKCTGLAIHIGARIAALASPGEVLVSDAVKTCVGEAFDFADRGTHELRGIPGTWKLSALQRQLRKTRPNLRTAETA